MILMRLTGVCVKNPFGGKARSIQELDEPRNHVEHKFWSARIGPFPKEPVRSEEVEEARRCQS